MEIGIDKQTALIISVGAIAAALILSKPDLLFGATECDCSAVPTCPDLTTETKQPAASAGEIRIQQPVTLRV